MDYIVKNNEPLALVNSMNSYFKQRPPDCSLFSQYNCEIKIHRELLYQTSYLRDMIKSVNMDYSCCKIEIICPLLSKSELETMVQFLYRGEISYSDEKTGAQIAKNLTEYFGFPPMSFVMNPKNNQSKYQNYGLKQDYKEEDVKIEMLDPESDTVCNYIFFIRCNTQS